MCGLWFQQQSYFKVHHNDRQPKRKRKSKPSNKENLVKNPNKILCSIMENKIELHNHIQKQETWRIWIQTMGHMFYNCNYTRKILLTATEALNSSI